MLLFGWKQTCKTHVPMKESPSEKHVRARVENNILVLHLLHRNPKSTNSIDVAHI